MAAELDGSRYWHGTFHLVAVYDQALTSGEVGQNFDAGVTDRVTAGVQALFEFDDGSGTTVADTSGVVTALDLTIGTPANATWGTGSLEVTGNNLISSGTAATKIDAAVTTSDEITVEAWIDPANLTQNGPARIVTISDTPSTRNMTLGQGVFNSTGDRIEARLRTTGTGSNGTPAAQTSTGVLDGGLQHVVYTRDSSGNTVIYVDGVSVKTGTASGNMSGWDSSYELALAAELDDSRWWHGTFHLVAIYDDALTATDVMQNYAAGADPVSSVATVTDVTSYYSFAGSTIGYGSNAGFTAIAAGHLGSTEATIVGATGVATRQTYTPYGAVRSGTSNGLGTDRTYTGQIDDGTGLMHYRARQYDPTLARFAQADTVVPNGTNAQALNRYSYVSGRAVTLVDVSGHAQCNPQDPGCLSRSNFERRESHLDGALLWRCVLGGNSVACGDLADQLPELPTDPACAADATLCDAQPGASGLGIAAELETISGLESLDADEFYEIARSAKEIRDRGLEHLDFSNDGCSNSPDSVGGISFLGPCAQHDFSYRNRKAYEDSTGLNVFSKETRRDADDRLERALATGCDARCDWSTQIYWVFVHGYGDGVGNPLPWDGWLAG